MMRWLKKTFIPHEGNNHHPHFWKDRSIALLLAIILIVELATLAQSALVFNKNSYLAAVLPSVLAVLTNDQRVINSAAPLAENSLLVQAAQEKAQDMANRGYFSHNTPEGYLPWYWLDKVGYTYSHAGENLAVNFTDSKDVVDAWMNSPTHRANIVKQVYTETGIGMAEGVYQGKQAIFVAQFFGTPAAPAPAPTVITSNLAQVPAAPKPNLEIVSKEIRVAVVPVKKLPGSSATSSATSSEAIALTFASTSASVLATSSTSTQRVAGTETDLSQVKLGVANSLAASPRHTGMYMLFILLGIVIAVFLLGLVINRKVHHSRIVLLCAALIVIIVGCLVLNSKLLKDSVQVGTGTGINTGTPVASSTI